MKLVAVCKDCGVEEQIRDPELQELPVLAQNDGDGRGMFVLDSGWASLPEGWSFNDQGMEVCGAH